MDIRPSTENIEESAQGLLQEAQRCEESGEFRTALEFYNRAITLSPDDGRIYFLRGNMQLEAGDAADAVESYSMALSIKPDSAGAHFNLGNAHGARRQRNEQLSAYRKAIALKPDFVDAHIALSLALEEQGNLTEAEHHLRQALLGDAESAGALFNLGNLLAEQGRHEEAIDCFRRAITAKPDYSEAFLHLCGIQAILGNDSEAEKYLEQAQRFGSPRTEIHNNVGALLKKLGHPDLAIAYYRKALIDDPDNAAVLNNIGVALKGQGQLEQAQEYFLKSISRKPDFALAYLNLGTVQFMHERFQQAIENCKQALALDPDLYDAANNLGAAYQQLGMFSQARDSYQNAIAIEPGNADAYNNLGNVLSNLGLHAEASTSYRKALELKPDYAVAFSNLLFTHNYSADGSPEELFKEALAFGKLTRQLASPFSSWNCSTDLDRALRIGLVSGDLVQHPVGFFLESILGELAGGVRGSLEFFTYHNHWRVDPLTERLKAHCRQWQTIYTWSDKQVAEQIRADGIDILIDLSGHTGKNRLPVFAWRPAPVQITWLGYFATTGMSEIDYLIADPWTLPVDEERYFSEKVIRLPHTRLCFTPPREGIRPAFLPALNNGYVTFGCQNNLSKLTDDVVELWSSILTSVPGSRLLIKARQLEEGSVRKALLERFTRQGIAEERLALEPPSDRAGYFATYNRIDIALDPFPYPGGTTTVEALWMGVPVLTLRGERFLGRQGVGLLQNAGLPRWIANNREHYLELAIAHAGNLVELSKLRHGLREQLLKSPIFDAHDFAKHFEQTLRKAWQTWCQAQQATEASAPSVPGV